VSSVTSLRGAVACGDLAEVERLVAGDRRAVRTLLGLSYHADPTLRDNAATGLALAARHHPGLVAEVVRRLVWAMNDESGTNAFQAPAVIRRIAEVEPRLLVPVVPDLLRLTADPGLRDELVAVVRRVAELLPGEVASAVRNGLGYCVKGGAPHAA
jgi:hypothetical protein